MLIGVGYFPAADETLRPDLGAGAAHHWSLLEDDLARPDDPADRVETSHWSRSPQILSSHWSRSTQILSSHWWIYAMLVP